MTFPNTEEIFPITFEKSLSSAYYISPVRNLVGKRNKSMNMKKKKPSIISLLKAWLVFKICFPVIEKDLFF